LTETLAKSGLSRANVARDKDTLRHPFREAKEEIEELRQQTLFFLSVRQSVGYVIYIEFCLVLEDAPVRCHWFTPQILTPNLFALLSKRGLKYIY
jgi:hypothetical protein